MRKITCPSCGQKHKTRGYPIICVRCQIHLCPDCGHELGGIGYDAQGHTLYDNRPCLVCGWKPEDN